MNVFEWANRHGCNAFALSELLDIIDPSRGTVIGDGTSEGDVQARLRVAAPKYGASLWRNNAGVAHEDERVIR